MRRGSEVGLTLIEVLVSVMLLSMLAVGMLAVIRMGFNAMHMTDSRMMANRRVVGAQRVLEQQIAGFMPVKTLCAPGLGVPQAPFSFFEGQPASMRLVSTFSLQEAWRGQPRILELQVIPGDQGLGVRLVVNEYPYTGPVGPGQFCMGMTIDPQSGRNVPQFFPIMIGPQSFVLADKLAFCGFSYLEPANPPKGQRWRPGWGLPGWPAAIRVEMAPLEDNPARLRPLTITAPIRINRDPDIDYVDF
jgi:hypothetical protein